MQSDLCRVNNTAMKGKEIFEITPIILGGSPTDSANKTLLSREQHIEAVTYWNKVIKEFKEEQKSKLP